MSLMDLLPRTKTREEILRNRARESVETLKYLRNAGKLSKDRDSTARFLLRKLMRV